jgi:hypothetical protein
VLLLLLLLLLVPENASGVYRLFKTKEKVFKVRQKTTTHFQLLRQAVRSVLVGGPPCFRGSPQQLKLVGALLQDRALIAELALLFPQPHQPLF